MTIYKVSVTTVGEDPDDDDFSQFSFEAPSAQCALDFIEELNYQDGNTWSCAHSYYRIDGSLDHPLDYHSSWKECETIFE